jgi:hypothetical protein
MLWHLEASPLRHCVAVGFRSVRRRPPPRPEITQVFGAAHSLTVKTEIGLSGRMRERI